ncbi:MAG: hypothetical protein ABI416_14685 [Ginsengibacter sp.]
MPDLSLNDEMNIEVRVLLIAKGTDDPVTGEEYLVRLYDKDIFNDDFLGQSALNDDGLAKFQLSKKHFAGFAMLDEKPDFYFVVYRNENEIFKSRVMKNLDLSDIEEFRMKEGEVVDLGTFLIGI